MNSSYYRQGFLNSVLKRFLFEAVAPAVTNQNFEGQVTGFNQKLNILSFLEDIVDSAYTRHTDITLQYPTDTQDVLAINNNRYFAFSVDDIDKAFAAAEDGSVVEELTRNARNKMEKAIDTRVLACTRAAKAGNWIGSDYVVGSTWFTSLSSAGALVLGPRYTIGYLTGTPAQFSDSALELQDKGCYISEIASSTAISHDGWFRVKTWTSSIAMTLEEWNSYTFGTLPGANIGAQGASYSAVKFEAGSPVQLAATTIYDYIVDLATRLDNSGVPETDRHLLMPPWAVNMLRKASELQPSIGTVYSQVVENGVVGKVSGFDIHKVEPTRFNRTVGISGTTGYEMLACHKSFITLGMNIIDSDTTKIPLQFGRIFKALYVYGATVAVERRKGGAVLYAYE